jgi:hypothetical protein
VPENTHATKFLINEVFSKIDFPLVIAGMNPPKEIEALVEKHKHISLVCNPDDDKMFDLIRNAHINVLVTFQATGLKLKLLNTLYNGRFCLVNDKMLNGTPLMPICNVANNAEALRAEIKRIAKLGFDKTMIDERRSKLNGLYCNKTNAEQLIGLIS